ncbi:histidinol-phosphate transaminase [Alicyclobacillus cycloheptanicus]|uniref:Histidinol-phosphate aminotransferase n=1 Tax=Alicyclobacillus cycloheptanicus TaxID=1457 RepID=A0ABT9XD59_9BACL|nr:histidinol-phosphate transaminase [Alicyclobacillus cycloheptanicus]MDQ0188231.1 histidinol-phosphate aminotransferase [Alicyclobacillus cycloheptanicus]WDM00959.1 histidinol-phosphate transaminase [Alicyclobacillus cycloheptanicus]
MLSIAERVRRGLDQIQPYVPGITDDEIRKMYGLRRIVKLNSNENALGPSPKALEAIRAELETLHLYPDGGSGRLREAVAAFHQVSADHVIAGNGSDNLIKLLSETFLQPGDEVVVPFPSFSQYNFGAQVMQADIVSVPLRPDFTYDVEALAGAVTARTKLVYACSPNNPTGTILKADEAKWLLDHLPEHVMLLLDLAYNDYTERPDRVRETADLLQDPRVVCLHTFSKLYGLAGLRIGYALAHPDVWNYVHRLREPFNVNRLAQRAAAAALQDEAHRQASVKHAAACRAFYLERTAEIGLEAIAPEGNFILVKTGDGRKTVQELMKLGVMVRAGFAGLDEYVRITYGLEEDNEACIEALAQVKGAL